MGQFTMGELIAYVRPRFATELPVECRYTASHFWLREEAEGVWRIGFTKLATWLLGDPVEFEFSWGPGAVVAVGQEIGWVEGLKALTTIPSVAEGELLGTGDGIRSDITLIGSEPYTRGWLYRVRGRPAPDCIDVHGYIALLDAAIEAIVRSRQDECGGDCAS
jgi:glycine cleavage system H protein